MKHSIRTWLALCTATLFVGSSCSMLDDHFPEPEDEPHVVELTMKVNVLGSSEEEVTRATTSPTAYDTYIHPTYFYASFFKENSASETKEHLSTMHATEVTLLSSSGDVATYLAHGYMDTIPTKSGYSFITVVNLPDYPYTDFQMGTTRLSDLMFNYGCFDWPAGQLPSQTHPIPMYGVFGTSGAFSKYRVEDDKYEITDASSLLRGLARIIVRSNTELTDVKLLKGNTKGLAIAKTLIYYAPGISNNSANWGDYSSNATLNIPGDNNYYPNLDPGRVDSIPFSVIPKKGSDKYTYNYILYVPEYKNKGVADADTTGLCFKLDGRDYHIPFGTYSDEGEFTGTRLNIDRNYSYEYILSLAPYKILYSVRPWDEEVAGEITFN